MIGKIKGRLAEIEGNECLIETAGGVFYKLFVTPAVLNATKINDSIEIDTFLNVKEDSLTLFGFEDKKKYHLFQLLLLVDGVGPKLAFSIISFTTSETLIEGVTMQNSALFNSIPGVGKKTAQKILLELSGKFDTEFQLKSTVLSADDKTVIEALFSLGFDKITSQALLEQIDSSASIEDKIAQAIRLLTNKRT